MSKKMTVKDLFEIMNGLQHQGFGDAEIVLSKDDEWNGFRNLYKEQITPFHENDNELESILSEFVSTDKKLIILG